jgi:hypothetical protein
LFSISERINFVQNIFSNEKKNWSISFK